MRIGIVGLGVISKNHIPAILATGHELVAICDVKPDRIDRAVEKHGLVGVAAYTDYVTMLNEAALDVVHICTPHHLHVPMIVEALSRDIHVFCEKPLAISHRQLDVLQKALKSSKARLGVCHQNRYNPASRFVKEFIGDRPVTAATATVSWLRDRAYYDSEEWRGKWDTEGGGVMINQALHTLDLLQWFCGYPVSANAITANLSLSDAIQVEDTAFGRFTLREGGNFVIHATIGAAANFPIEIMLRVGDDTVSLCRNTVTVNGKTVSLEESAPVLGKAEYGAGHPAIIADFYDAILHHTPFSLELDEAAKVIRLILAMYESNGATVSL